MGKILAIDFGLKRTGLAISDESQTFAFGLKTIESRALEATLLELVKKEKVDVIVIGEPKRLNNTDSHITQNVRLLHQHLTQLFPIVKVILHDERFTSKMASAAIQQMNLKKSVKQQKELVDEVSATIILQSFLSTV
jgi:putative Holliday junction resolvase